jgi:phage shock protein A
MNVFKRIRYIVRGRTDSLLESLEDPEQQLNVFVSELQEQVVRTQQAVTAAMADEKRLKMQIDEYLARANEWENRAVLALREGNESLAKEALLKKEECEAASLALQKGWTAQKQATDKLKVSLRAIKQRVAEAKRKYTLLVAQYKSAQAKKKVNEVFAVAGADSPMMLMEKLSDKICKLEAEAEAVVELSAECGDGEIEIKFVELERKRKGDAALELLKAKLSQNAGASSATS